MPSAYLDVSSNDTLGHKALPKSPDTLCGKPVTDVLKPRQVADLSVEDSQALECDICARLAGQSLLAESSIQIEAATECPHCDGGFLASGDMCWNCNGTGWLETGDDFVDPIHSDTLKGTKVATQTSSCPACGTLNTTDNPKCPSCHYDGTGPLGFLPSDEGRPERYRVEQTDEGPKEKTSRQSSVEKIATNWTRDGMPIENGFEVVITKEEAARIPFLDYARVSVSEKRECPDCRQSQWLSKISACDSCGTMKCTDCMEDVALDSFIGMCKNCAGADSDLTYETNYEDSIAEPNRYAAYLLSQEDDDVDPLFLPPGVL